MTDRRRTYTKEFKMEAIKLVTAQRGNASSVARDLGIAADLLNRWIREYKADREHAFPGLGKQKEPEEESRWLRKELTDTKMERDIFKKSLGHFLKTVPMKYRFIQTWQLFITF